MSKSCEECGASFYKPEYDIYCRSCGYTIKPIGLKQADTEFLVIEDQYHPQNILQRIRYVKSDLAPCSKCFCYVPETSKFCVVCGSKFEEALSEEISPKRNTLSIFDLIWTSKYFWIGLFIVVVFSMYVATQNDKENELNKIQQSTIEDQ